MNGHVKSMNFQQFMEQATSKFSFLLKYKKVAPCARYCGYFRCLTAVVKLTEVSDCTLLLHSSFKHSLFFSTVWRILPMFKEIENVCWYLNIL